MTTTEAPADAGSRAADSSLSEAALTYTRRGFPVVLLNGKRPVMSEWPKLGVPDEATVQQWYDESPGANVGIATGVKHDVLDVDGEDGRTNLERLEAEHGKLPDTTVVRTGSGGLHYYFRPTGAGNRTNMDGLHLDWRGVGGQVVAPPSTHPDTGQQYRVISKAPDGVYPEAPPWLIEMVTSTRAKPSFDMPVIEGECKLSDEACEKLFQEQLAVVRNTTEGGRNAQLNRSAFDIFGFVKAGWSDAQTVWDAFDDAARDAGLPDDDTPFEIEKTLQSAWDSARPKYKVDLVASAVDIGANDMTKPNEPAVATVSSDVDPAIEDDEAISSSWQRIDLRAAVAGEKQPPPTMLERSDGEKLIYPGKTHWFQGAPESCKSWAAQLATADEVKAHRYVLYLDFEDDQVNVVERLLAMGCKADDIIEYVVYTKPDEPLFEQGRFTDVQHAVPTGAPRRLHVRSMHHRRCYRGHDDRRTRPTIERRCGSMGSTATEAHREARHCCRCY